MGRAVQNVLVQVRSCQHAADSININSMDYTEGGRRRGAGAHRLPLLGLHDARSRPSPASGPRASASGELAAASSASASASAPEAAVSVL